MRLILTLLTSLLLPTLSLTATVPTLHYEKNYTATLSIPCKHNANFKFHGRHALRHTYHKHGIPLPVITTDPIRGPVLNTSHSTRATTVAISARPEEFDSEYFAPVTIGGQVLRLDFDTGASDTWVFSTLTSTEQSTGHPLFNPTLSPTIEFIPRTFNISFQEGSSVTGRLVRDTLSLGPVNASVAVVNQTLGLAAEVTERFSHDTPFAGLLGLGFTQRARFLNGSALSFWDNVSRVLKEKVFTVDLRPGWQTGRSGYDFGFISPLKYRGEIEWLPVNNASGGRWEVQATGYGVAQDKVQKVEMRVVLDTGSSIIILPDELLGRYYAKILGANNSEDAGGWTVPCNTTLPSVSFQLGKRVIRLAGRGLNFEDLGDGVCFTSLQSNRGSGISVFGDTFFKEQFVIFDGGNLRIGFAQKP